MGADGVELWEVEQTARTLQCSKWTIYTLIHLPVNPLPAFKPANRYLFKPAEVFAWLETRRTNANGQPQSPAPRRAARIRRRRRRAAKAVLSE